MGLLALVAISNYADGPPLFSQESFCTGDGIDPSRSNMVDGMGQVGCHPSRSPTVSSEIRAGDARDQLRETGCLAACLSAPRLEPCHPAQRNPPLR